MNIEVGLMVSKFFSDDVVQEPGLVWAIEYQMQNNMLPTQIRILEALAEDVGYGS